MTSRHKSLACDVFAHIATVLPPLGIANEITLLKVLEEASAEAIGKAEQNYLDLFLALECTNTSYLVESVARELAREFTDPAGPDATAISEGWIQLISQYVEHQKLASFIQPSQQAADMLASEWHNAITESRILHTLTEDRHPTIFISSASGRSHRRSAMQYIRDGTRALLTTQGFILSYLRRRPVLLISSACWYTALVMILAVVQSARGQPEAPAGEGNVLLMATFFGVYAVPLLSLLIYTFRLQYHEAAARKILDTRRLIEKSSATSRGDDTSMTLSDFSTRLAARQMWLTDNISEFDTMAVIAGVNKFSDIKRVLVNGDMKHFNSETLSRFVDIHKQFEKRSNETDSTHVGS